MARDSWHAFQRCPVSDAWVPALLRRGSRSWPSCPNSRASPRRPNRARNSRNELRNLERQSLQLRCAGDGAKEVLGGNDAHRHLFFLFVLNLHVTT
jgi:hypothetical protein